MKKKEKVINLVIYAFLILVLLITILPLLYTVFGSFKSNAEILTHPERLIPSEPTLQNYLEAINSDEFNVLQMFWNSTYYSVLTVLITVTTALATGYVFARGGEFPGSKVIFAIFSSLMFVSLGGITIYPKFDVLRLFGLNDSLWGLIFMKIFAISIADIYIARGYIWSLPKELDEAAALDGCSFIGTFFRVILPLLKPVVATLSILAFKGAWNEYLMPMLFTLTRKDQRTLVAGIMAMKNAGESTTNWNILLAGATVAMLPILVIYAFCNKYFVQGIAAGAVKG